MVFSGWRNLSVLCMLSWSWMKILNEYMNTIFASCTSVKFCLMCSKCKCKAMPLSGLSVFVCLCSALNIFISAFRFKPNLKWVQPKWEVYFRFRFPVKAQQVKNSVWSLLTNKELLHFFNQPDRPKSVLLVFCWPTRRRFVNSLVKVHQSWRESNITNTRGECSYIQHLFPNRELIFLPFKLFPEFVCLPPTHHCSHSVIAKGQNLKCYN